ncbi:MAG TPA: DUF4124 domain-containing protein [Frateuria sp.]|uniref:DUF4124 domain-containing protein n=1 Tax=Frateuria sp. TaxID=2211372 RepID=UPI002DE96323|nr:DUF4124 domain-containing protein [Frateuria sp.]
MPALRLSCLLLLSLAAFCARAQTPIRRCIGADGQPVFTDQPCASLQATPAPATSAAIAPPSLRPPAVTCAADAEALRQAVIDAFADGDANRLAGLMLWAGYGKGAAVADIRALSALMRRPLLGIELADTADDPAAGRPALVVRTVATDDSGGGEETRFAIEPHSGCLWLRQE